MKSLTQRRSGAAVLFLLLIATCSLFIVSCDNDLVIKITDHLFPEEEEVVYVTPDYGISLSVTGTYIFPSAVVGYTAQSQLEVIVTNIGLNDLGTTLINITGAHSTNFILSPSSISTIPFEDEETFTITPNTGLGAGTYTATVTVSSDDGYHAPLSFNVSFTVGLNAAPSASDFDYTDISVVYDGTAKEATVTYISPYDNTNAGTPVIYYGSSIANATTIPPVYVGDYNVYVETPGGTTYGALGKTFINAFTITPLQLTIEAPTDALTKVYDGTKDVPQSIRDIILSGTTNKIGTDTVNVGITSATYTDPAVAYPDNKITVVYTISGAQSGNYSAPSDGVYSAIITKAPSPATATVSATPVSKTTTTITISASLSGNPAEQTEIQYTYSTLTIPTVSDTDWQDSPSFTGLTAGTTYNFFARAKESANYLTGAPSTGVEITMSATSPGITINLWVDDPSSEDLLSSDTNFIISKSGTGSVTDTSFTAEVEEGYKITLIGLDGYIYTTNSTGITFTPQTVTINAVTANLAVKPIYNLDVIVSNSDGTRYYTAKITFAVVD